MQVLNVTLENRKNYINIPCRKMQGLSMIKQAAHTANLVPLTEVGRIPQIIQRVLQNILRISGRGIERRMETIT